VLRFFEHYQDFFGIWRNGSFLIGVVRYSERLKVMLFSVSRFFLISIASYFFVGVIK